jgi:bacillithiol system protein YtxJ
MTMTEPVVLTAQIEVDRLFDESKERPVVIFKNSPRCSISAHAYGMFRQHVAGKPRDAALFAVVDVLASRAVSDELARRTGVRHESPQVIVLRGGRVVWAASHWDVAPEGVDAALSADGP